MQIKQLLFVVISFILAICLSIIPMPQWANWLRPAWVIFVLAYWIMRYPEYINVGIAWITGLLLDVLYGTILGEHALATVVVAYIIYRATRYLKHYPLMQQSLFIVLCCFIYNFILFSIQWSIGQWGYNSRFWISPLLAILLWPVIFTTFRKLLYKFRIA